MGSDKPIEIDPAEARVERVDAVAVDPARLEVSSFCRSLCPRLVGALSLCCGNREDAEELAQETLSRVLEHWDRLQRHQPPPECEGPRVLVDELGARRLRCCSG